MQTRLVCVAIKPSLYGKEALFAKRVKCGVETGGGKSYRKLIRLRRMEDN